MYFNLLHIISSNYIHIVIKKVVIKYNIRFNLIKIVIS